jgi:hypothetical protein
MFNNNLNRYEPLEGKTLQNRDKYIKNNMRLILQQYEYKAEIEAVQEAASKLDEKALAYYYIKAIEGMANSKGSKVFFPSEFTQLASSFAQATNKGGKGAAKVEYYKNILKDYVDTSVKKATGNEKTKESSKKKSKKEKN